jgi:hypothetical protein
MLLQCKEWGRKPVHRSRTCFATPVRKGFRRCWRMHVGSERPSQLCSAWEPIQLVTSSTLWTLIGFHRFLTKGALAAWSRLTAKGMKQVSARYNMASSQGLATNNAARPNFSNFKHSERCSGLRPVGTALPMVRLRRPSLWLWRASRLRIPPRLSPLVTKKEGHRPDDTKPPSKLWLSCERSGRDIKLPPALLRTPANRARNSTAHPRTFFDKPALAGTAHRAFAPVYGRSECCDRARPRHGRSTRLALQIL